MMDDESETDLIQQARAGSSRAFRILMQQNQRTVRLFLMRMGDDRTTSDDLAQETFATAWTHLSRFRGRSRFRTWLCAIAYRKSLMARRSAGRERSRLDDKGLVTGDITTRPDLKIDLERALQSLPPQRRAAVILCLANGFSHEEVAEALALPLGTVKSHVSRGRDQLKSLLGGDNQDG